MIRHFRNAVVVITGASSGIGRATALALARRGAIVVLAARREDALEEVALQCRRLGGRALVVPTDVAREEEVHALAERVMQELGRMDAWINNAAVGLYGWFDEIPAAAYRRALETDLFGTIHGAREALRVFRQRGHGVLVNVSSVVGKIGQPWASAYVISKHGVRVLGDCLRQELLLQGLNDIHVCTVLPAAVDTPFFAHAANYLDHEVKPMAPVYAPERVASKIVEVLRSPRRETFVGGPARVLSMPYRLAPALGEQIVARAVARGHVDHHRPAHRGDGALFHPMHDGLGVSGGWRHPPSRMRRRVKALGMAAVPALLGWMLTRSSSGTPRLLH
ncbi:MAG: SDR family oxidoreductase [Myxococcota bacterium]